MKPYKLRQQHLILHHHLIPTCPVCHKLLHKRVIFYHWMLM